MDRLIHSFVSRRDFFIGLFSLGTFLSLWELLPSLGWADPFFFSSPSRIITTALAMFKHGFWNDVQVSLVEFFLGMLISIVLGVLLGLLIGWYPKLYAVFEPFITMLNTAPRVALIPIVILWLGIGLQSKIAAVIMGAFFPIAISVMKSVRTLDESLLRCARSFGARDDQIFLTLIIPNSIPFVMSGLHIAIGRGLVGVVLGEMLASQAGIGHVMAVASSTFQTDRMFVGLVILAGFGYLLTKLVEYVGKFFERWRVL